MSDWPQIHHSRCPVKPNHAHRPDIQAAILGKTLPDNVSLFDLAVDTPLSREEQRGRVTYPAAKQRKRVFADHGSNDCMDRELPFALTALAVAAPPR